MAKTAACVFCAIRDAETPAHLVWADENLLAFLDSHPLFEGHTLVVPRGHHVTLADLPDGTVHPLFNLVKRLSIAVPAAVGATGSFVAMNNIVSQSVPHLHVHVVPRTKGDGLRGFFWPRVRYASEEAAATMAQRIASELEKVALPGAD